MLRIMLYVLLVLAVGILAGYVADKFKSTSRATISRTGRLVVFLDTHPQGAVVLLVMVALVIWGAVQIFAPGALSF